jgi:hypothetical protein
VAATDAARVLRAASSRNFKHDPPLPVVAVWLTDDRYTARRVVGELPDSPSYLAAVQRPPTGVPVAPGRIHGLLHTVREAPKGNRNCALYWAAMRAVEHVATGAISEAEVRELLAEAASDAGLPDGRIYPTLRSAFRSPRPPTTPRRQPS